MKTVAVRQGDLAFIKSKLPEGLKSSKSKVLLQVGSGGNPHSFDKGTFYPKQEGEFIIGYLKTKGTKLFHPEHGTGEGALRSMKIPDGLWEVRRQVEDTNEGFRQVID